MNTPKFNTPPNFKNTPPQAAPQAAPVPPQAAPAPPVPPQAAPAQQAPPVPPQAAPAPAPKEKKQQSTIMINNDHIKFVLQNIKTMGYNDMAEKLGITKNQVNRILQTLKGGIGKKKVQGEEVEYTFGLRGKALDAAAAAGEQAYALKENGKPDFSQPVSELAQKVEAKIDAELSRPADTRPGAGGGGRGGKVQEALDSQLDELLAGL
jgi:predicted DNA-binding protein (UPF0251 family)